VIQQHGTQVAVRNNQTFLCLILFRAQRCLNIVVAPLNSRETINKEGRSITLQVEVPSIFLEKTLGRDPTFLRRSKGPLLPIPTIWIFLSSVQYENEAALLLNSVIIHVTRLGA